jgi:hypothetical protein
MNLNDVAERNGTMIARFSDFLDLSPLVEMVLEVKITPQQEEQLLAKNKASGPFAFSRFAIVARVEEVVRPRFEASVETPENHDVRLRLEDSPAVFVLRGTCSELLADEKVSKNSQ